MTEDMTSAWGDWGVSSEIGRLHAVLLRRPGSELDAVTDFDAMQMRSDLSPDRVREQHDALADAYRAAGVVVHYVERGRIDKPNAMFVRDLMLMTPEGAIVTRPASTVRAGEERLVAEALAQLGVPILMSVHGSGTFEGPTSSGSTRISAFSPRGCARTRKGPTRSSACCARSVWRRSFVSDSPTVRCISTGYSPSSIAILPWSGRGGHPSRSSTRLRKRGFRFIEVDDEREAQECLPMNFVALAPGEVLMPAGGSSHAPEVRGRRGTLPRRRHQGVHQGRWWYSLHDRFSEAG